MIINEYGQKLPSFACSPGTPWRAAYDELAASGFDRLELKNPGCREIYAIIDVSQGRGDLPYLDTLALLTIAMMWGVPLRISYRGKEVRDYATAQVIRDYPVDLDPYAAQMARAAGGDSFPLDDVVPPCLPGTLVLVLAGRAFLAGQSAASVAWVDRLGAAGASVTIGADVGIGVTDDYPCLVLVRDAHLSQPGERVVVLLNDLARFEVMERRGALSALLALPVGTLDESERLAVSLITGAATCGPESAALAELTAGLLLERRERRVA